MSNSMRDILDKLAAGAGTQGWGAIAAISRSDLNQQLQRQYVERYQRLAFMPLFTGEARGKDLSVDTLGLEGVELGVPTLLFQAQSSIAASVVVTMNIVAGRYSGVHQSLSSATTVSGTFKITEPMGFRLTMTVQLATDDTGQVTLNLAEGSAFTCNLAGLDEAGNVRLAQFFADMFKQIPLHRSVFHWCRWILNNTRRSLRRAFGYLQWWRPARWMRARKTSVTAHCCCSCACMAVLAKVSSRQQRACLTLYLMNMAHTIRTMAVR